MLLLYTIGAVSYTHLDVYKRQGRNFVKDFMSGIRDIVGGRSGSYEDSLMNARKAALDEMSQRASKLGANAIIGVSFQYSTVGAQNGMLMITCNGTAVVV